MRTSFPAPYTSPRRRRNPLLVGVTMLLLCTPAVAEPLIKGVEREADRGRGRVTDRPTYQLDRIERSQQSPPPREIDVVLEEEDRRRILERQREREGRSILDDRRHQMQPPAPADDPARQELVSVILAAVERRDLKLAQARRELPPEALPDREAQINQRFAEELRRQLEDWRRGAPPPAPATQPAG